MISLRKLRAILGGRVARNVYFWALLIYTRFEFKYTWVMAGFTAVIFGWLMVLFYVNNLLLIPKYLSRRKYNRYFLWYTALTAAVTLGYLATIKIMIAWYPQYGPYAISPVVLGNETGVMTVEAFLAEGWPYFITLFITGCIFAMSWYVMDHQRQQKLVEEARKQHLEMELAFLKNQINPHFLFNSLNNLYALTIKKSDAAPEVVSRISTILRYLLYESDTRVVSFSKEKQIMQAYTDLVLLGMTNTENMKFSVSADRNYLLPPLLWLPVLENVFKHGTRFISPSYHIDYSFSIENGILRICSCNTFKPEQSETGKQAGGIGLKNLTQRLNLLFNGNYDMQIKTEDNRYMVDIRINIEAA